MRRLPPDSLRARIVLAVGASVAVVLAAVAVVVVRSTAHDDRARLDRRLVQRSAVLVGPVARALRRDVAGDDGTVGALAPAAAVLLRSSGTGVRVVDGQRERLRLGDLPPAGDLPVPTQPGLRTVRADDGSRWRTSTRRTPAGALVEVVEPLAPIDERIDTLTRTIALLSLAGVAVASALAALGTSLLLRPLARLRATADEIAATEDPTRPVPQAGTREVRDLAAAFDRMLRELAAASASRDRALAATRRFVADAGHELRTPLATIRANLETLARNPDLPAAQRQEIIRDALDDEVRLVALTDALQQLARGDSGAVGDEGPVDVADLTALAVAAARARHPGATLELVEPEAEATITGSPDGLRSLLDNLLENALRHGGDPVRVQVCVDGDAVVVTVDDGGPGIPVDERARVTERFARGRGATGEGSGLGLAIAAQEAARHGGALELGDAPGGGARVVVGLRGSDAGDR